MSATGMLDPNSNALPLDYTPIASSWDTKYPLHAPPMQGMQLKHGSTNVSANDVVNGNREATLGLLWRVFLQFQVLTLSPAAAICCPQALLLLADLQVSLPNTDAKVVPVVYDVERH